MKINRKIQILAILSILVIALAAIGISANSIINQKPNYQQNFTCPDNEDCPQPYCNYQQQTNCNYQQRFCCNFRI